MASRSLTLRKRQELARQREAGVYHIPQDSDLIIADVSGSMDERAFEGKRKIDCLREAVAPFVGRAAVLAFSSNIFECQADAIPDPQAMTDLTRALKFAKGIKPIHVLVCCDGYPDNRDTALEAAKELAEDCVIDALYIGPANCTNEIEFMKQLARAGRGRFVQFDIANKSPLLLGKQVDAMLALPSPDAIVL